MMSNDDRGHREEAEISSSSQLNNKQKESYERGSSGRRDYVDT